MNTGTKLRVVGDLLSTMTLREDGMLIPKPDHLAPKQQAAEINRGLRLDSEVGRRIHSLYYSADVSFSYRPSCTGPVCGFGYKVVGSPPKRGNHVWGDGIEKQIGRKTYLREAERRAEREKAYQRKAMAIAAGLPEDTPTLKLLKEIEQDQVMTGGAYDNTELFQITRSALEFLNKSMADVDDDAEADAAFMQAVRSVARDFPSQIGVEIGTLKPAPYYEVRAAQEADGTICYPLYYKSQADLDEQAARRIGIGTGVAPLAMVDREVTDPLERDPSTGAPLRRRSRVVDGICYSLDRATYDFVAEGGSKITTLARIQRHGWKEEDGEIQPKPGKARNVSPMDLRAGAVEAMTFYPVIKKMQESKLSWMPSLQDYDNQVSMVRRWFEEVLIPAGMQSLAADWSGYDKTVKGKYLATAIYHIIRPLFADEYKIWVDAAIHDLVYKYYILDVDACKYNHDLYKNIPSDRIAELDDGLVLVATYNGLCSGAKFTHAGGSLYGEIIIHHAVPILLGWQPVYGLQAGDDTAMGVPKERIILSSVEETYTPIKEAAARFGLDMNESKQIWRQAEGEVATIFLQYTYHSALGIWGVGSPGRQYSGLPYVERNKGLSFAEQTSIPISKMSQGVTSPFIENWIHAWLELDDVTCALFKTYGVQGFTILSEAIGGNLQEITERLGLQYNWAVSAERLRDGDLPIIEVLARVASSMSPKMSGAQALEFLKLTKVPEGDGQNYVPEVVETVPDDTDDD